MSLPPPQIRRTPTRCLDDGGLIAAGHTRTHSRRLVFGMLVALMAAGGSASAQDAAQRHDSAPAQADTRPASTTSTDAAAQADHRQATAQVSAAGGAAAFAPPPTLAAVHPAPAEDASAVYRDATLYRRPALPVGFERPIGNTRAKVGFGVSSPPSPHKQNGLFSNDR